MEIWTARYSNRNVGRMCADGAIAVPVSRGLPRFPVGYRFGKKLLDLAPTRDMFNLELGPFKRKYVGQLNLLGPEAVEGLLGGAATAGTSDPANAKLILLCFEDVRIEGQWCHRTMLAQWLSATTGIGSLEVPEPSPAKRTKPTSGSLF